MFFLTMANSHYSGTTYRLILLAMQLFGQKLIQIKNQ